MINKLLWYVYGYLYDGLLNFYPYRNLVKLVSQRAGNNVGRTLEIGCGTGNILNAIASNSSQNNVVIVGVDMSSSMLRIAKKKLQLNKNISYFELEQSDILAFLKKQPDASYDTIVSVNVLYALRQRDEVWTELFRILKQDGQMVMTTSVQTGSSAIINEHVSNSGALSLIRPKLIGVFIVDSLINLLGNTGSFPFPSKDKLKSEVIEHGGTWEDELTCYGGSKDGVNVLFTVYVGAHRTR